MPATELLDSNCNLDRKNPRAKGDIAHLPPEQIAASILENQKRIAEIMGRIQKLLARSAESSRPAIAGLSGARFPRQ